MASPQYYDDDNDDFGIGASPEEVQDQFYGQVDVQNMPLDGEGASALFASRKMRDVVPLVVWLLHLLFLLIFTIVGGARLRALLSEVASTSAAGVTTAPTFGTTTAETAEEYMGVVLRGVLTSLVLQLGIVVAVAVLLMLALRYVPRGVLIGTLVVPPVLLLLVGVLFVLSPALRVVGVVFLLLAAGLGVFGFLQRKRIPFTAVMLRTTAAIVGQYYGTFVVSVLLLVPLLLLFIFYCNVAVYGLFVGDAVLHHYWVWFSFVLLTLLWSISIVHAVSHTTTAGVVGVWYFLPAGQTKHATLGSLRRAVTYSLGSIVFGSLITALLQLVRSLFKNRLLRRLLSFVDRVVRYFNVYAFSRVALYGEPYMEAARQSWDLLKRRGLTMVLNDSLIGLLRVYICLATAVLCAVSSLLVRNLVDMSDLPEGIPGAIIFMSAVIGLVFGFATMGLILRVVSGAASTLFLCIAEDPTRLQLLRPELYEEIRTAYPNTILGNEVEEGL